MDHKCSNTATARHFLQLEVLLSATKHGIISYSGGLSIRLKSNSPSSSFFMLCIPVALAMVAVMLLSGGCTIEWGLARRSITASYTRPACRRPVNVSKRCGCQYAYQKILIPDTKLLPWFTITPHTPIWFNSFSMVSQVWEANEEL